MNDTAIQDFFLRPTQSLHRQYEALRAVFVAQQPLADVAQQFGYRYGSLRNLVSDFRARWRAGQAPPFSAPHFADGLRDRTPRHRSASRSERPLRTAGNWLSPQGGAYAPASLASFSSCRCWHVCASTRWWLRPVIQDRAWSRRGRRC
jgi:hypothetical protein